MKFLIPTDPEDQHVLLVKLALESQGHHVRLLFMADHPKLQKNSVLIEQGNYRWKSADRYDSILGNDYDVVWFRRACPSYLPRSMAQPEDYSFVARENQLFQEAIMYNLAPDAWWVNPKGGAARANSKIVQLQMASACEIKIPLTLCSNDPLDIRNFLLLHENQGVIYKPLCSNGWYEPPHGKDASLLNLTFLGLPRNKVLQLTPGIYQKEIKKKHAVRVTCFGDELVAAKIEENVNDKAKIELSVEPIALPSTLEAQIRTLMRRLDIVFAVIDFIVTDENQYVFSDLNEQGDFLWLDNLNPEFHFLDRFVQFLVNRSRVFQWDSEQRQHTTAAYQDEVELLMEENLRRHVNLNDIATL